MTLYFVGLGLGNEKDITLNGLEAVKNCDFVYLESYTSKLDCDVKALEELYSKEIIIADRELVEKEAENTILKNAASKNVAFLVIGDVFGATTHTDLFLRARKEGIDIKVFHNTSIINAVGDTGLQLYKFGKTTSVPFPEGNYLAETPYNILKENHTLGAHTLLLLDLKPEQKKFMSISDAISYLMKVELKLNEKVFTSETFCVGCARLGHKDSVIKIGKAKDLLKENFGKAPHCLIVPGKLHFMEEEFLKKL